MEGTGAFLRLTVSKTMFLIKSKSNFELWPPHDAVALIHSNFRTQDGF